MLCLGNVTITDRAPRKSYSRTKPVASECVRFGILLMKRMLVASLDVLCCVVHVSVCVPCPFLAVQLVGLQSVFVAFPGYTHLPFAPNVNQ